MWSDSACDADCIDEAEAALAAERESTSGVAEFESGVAEFASGVAEFASRVAEFASGGVELETPSPGLFCGTSE